MSKGSGGPIGGTMSIEVAIRGETASALRHAGNTLDVLLGKLQALTQRYEAATDAAERTRLADEHEALWKEADYRRWCLIVKREAMGLMHHGVLDDVYPMPRRIRPSR